LALPKKQHRTFRESEETSKMPGQNGSSGQNGSHVQLQTDLLAAVARHRFKVLTFGCLMLAGAIFLALAWPKTYRSEAKLYVRLGRENLGLDATTSMGHEISGLQISREEELNTVVELLRSRSLLEKVVDAVGPQVVLAPTTDVENTSPSLLSHVRQTVRQWTQQVTNDVPLTPREKAVLALRQQLDIQNVRKTDVILVGHEGPSPIASQEIVSSLINLYLDEHLRMSRSPHAHAFLAEQAGNIKQQLVQRENELKIFKDQTGLASPAEQRLTLVSQIGRLEDDLKTTQASIEATQAENRAIVAEQDRASRVDSKVHDELRLMLIKEKPALASQQAKLSLLTTQLAAAKEQLRVLNGNEQRITQMQREAQLLEASYRKYSEGLEQARLDESLESQRISNINVAQPATLSVQPVRPQRSLFAIGGLLLALVGGPGLAVLYEAYRSRSSTRGSDHRLDMPTLTPTPALRDPQPMGV
jgi:polysaccharide biosynthesis protein PslE